MPSSALMGYTTPTDNTEAGTWGSDVNANFTNFVDVNFAGLTTLSLSSSNVSLTAAQARTQMIRLTGTLLANVQIDGGGNLWNGIRCVENITSGSFAITLLYGGLTVTIPQSRRCLVFLDTTNGPRIVSIAGSATADPIPSGNSVLFPQASPPAGWTQNTGLTDYALRLVNGTGGGTTGSQNFSTVFGITATQNYTLQVADIPAHTHTPSTGSTHLVGVTGGGLGSGGGTISDIGALTLANTGGGGPHSHNINLQVKYVDIISAVRN